MNISNIIILGLSCRKKLCFLTLFSLVGFENEGVGIVFEGFCTDNRGLAIAVFVV